MISRLVDTSPRFQFYPWASTIVECMGVLTTAVVGAYGPPPPLRLLQDQPITVTHSSPRRHVYLPFLNYQTATRHEALEIKMSVVPCSLYIRYLGGIPFRVPFLLSVFVLYLPRGSQAVGIVRCGGIGRAITMAFSPQITKRFIDAIQPHFSSVHHLFSRPRTRILPTFQPSPHP